MQNAPFFVDTEVITLNREGVWLSDETEITHEPTRRLFSKSLFREGEEWVLRVGRERKTIVVEDTPYFVLALRGSAKEGFILLLSDETQEKLIPENLLYAPGRLVMTLQRGEDAKFLRAPYYEILSHAEKTSNGHELHIENQTFLLRCQS